MKRGVVHRFIRRKASVAAFFLLVLIILLCFLGPLFLQIDPLQQNLGNIYAKPSSEHLLGTDNLGRDVLSRLLYGGRTSLTISFIGVIIGTAIGVLLGVVAGYFGGVLDTLISRFLDILLAFPGLLLAIVIVAVLGIGLQNTVIAISIFSIPYVARMVRGEVLEVKTNEYVAACIAMGQSDTRIILTHIIPNSISQIIVNVTLQLVFLLDAPEQVKNLCLNGDIEGRYRFITDDDIRMQGYSPRDTDALSLTPGELMRETLGMV